MTERDLLLKAVCEHPEDDTPRLVLADWLQENGEEARAEFIRLQVLMAQVESQAKDNWPAWQRLCARESELRIGHDEEWWRELPEAPGYRLGRLFVRGFVERAMVTQWDAFARDVEVVLAASPIVALSVNCRVDLAQLTVTETLARFPTLGLATEEFTEADWLALVATPLPKLKLLSVREPFGDLRFLCRRLEARFGERLHFSDYRL